MKKILVIHYSQTGQLTEVLKALTQPLTLAGVQVDHLPITPVTPYPFPWSRMGFFGVFPESVNGDPVPLLPAAAPSSNYDLIIFGYTIWYLNPSIPANSFLRQADPALFRNTPVLTVIGARNMWVHAQEKVRKMLKGLGGIPVGNIVAEDRASNMVSLVTIIRWMFWGKKEAFFLFPPAGIREADIASNARFAPEILARLESRNWDGFNKKILQLGSAQIKPALLILEKRALVLFGKYRSFMLAKVATDPTSRDKRVRIFSVALPIGAFILSPITALTTFLVSIFRRKAIQREVDELLSY
ncbi:MAG: dialkylresorcinol condensing enzyme DarA [Flavobacteriales bacterium]|nr:dialkylresorcinol condensing enzyme DarA [Flavobacteriales bacterium]MBK6943457.1 dialkylresorcinol condensing enzyme DarA [Flavobacteriales bacterium]MBK7240656.1 dialkylresorcinol condensing enzyme DarA [Flavobacteriales bacterium]MBK9536006.1 dialkylresorcinol condensing enzyme DarA [Flavobacteriales bacterium]MBP9139096.1 dialkylresorcinol condensing enzyme DarA [Flavobacteriales bacterium]